MIFNINFIINKIIINGYNFLDILDQFINLFLSIIIININI